MINSPMVWGASLACALGGAVAGNAVGSTPVLDRSTIASFYQEHDTGNGTQVTAARTPDHYPLVTRDGIVPVAALSERGLYSQRRYQAIAYAADYGPGEVSRSYEPDQPQYQGEDAVSDRTDMAESDYATSNDAASPLELAVGPAKMNRNGQAKVIDVAAMLAMR